VDNFAKTWHWAETKEAWKRVACHSLHEAFQTNRLEHVVLRASNTFRVGTWLYSMALRLGLDAGHVITSVV
jgi:hypothetical protein